MKIGIVGCGFVADYYLRTLPLHPKLHLGGVFDIVPERAEKFARFYSVERYASLEEMLSDASVDIVVNLTNPRSHHAVSRAALLARKHVYSEKPLAMTMEEASELVTLAREGGLHVVSAPCSLLGECAQTLWKALRERKVGRVYLVYAEMDDGLVPRMPYQKWASESGTPWPYKDEFEVGCTLEHAGYYLTWLTAFFGPAQVVSAFSASLVPDKADVPLDIDAPDFSVGCIQFASGVVARLTCSIIAPHDHHLRFFGESGILTVDDGWLYDSPVYINRFVNVRRKMIVNPLKERCAPVRALDRRLKQGGAQRMDFCRGIAEMAEAIQAGRDPRLSSEFSLHNIELTLAIQNAWATAGPHHLTTTFMPPAPMPWGE